jgi:hypothetical protein
MWRTDSTNQDAEAALVACLRHFAARGRNLRGRALREASECKQKTKSAERLGGGAADLVRHTGELSLAGDTDA